MGNLRAHPSKANHLPRNKRPGAKADKKGTSRRLIFPSKKNPKKAGSLFQISLQETLAFGVIGFAGLSRTIKQPSNKFNFPWNHSESTSWFFLRGELPRVSSGDPKNSENSYVTCKLHHLCRNAIEDEQPQKIKQHLFFLSFYLLLHHGIFIFISGFHVWFLDYGAKSFLNPDSFLATLMLPDSGKVDCERLLDNIATHIARVCEVALVPFLELPTKVTVASLCSGSGGRELAVTTTACTTTCFH